MKNGELFDPKGLMKDAFAMVGISESECRSIFLDWVLSVPDTVNLQGEVERLIGHYAPLHAATHPMLETLRAAGTTSERPKRRGGRKTRLSRDTG